MVYLQALILKEKRNVSLAYGIYVVYGLVLLQHFFLLFFKANVPHLILVHCIPVKTLGCKPKRIASCSLKTKQNKTKNEEEEESVRRFLDCRLEDLARGRDRYCQNRCRSKNRTPGNFLERRPLPAVLATALSQMNSQYPVSLSHLFLVLSPGGRIPDWAEGPANALAAREMEENGLIGFYWHMEVAISHSQDLT